jgi:hypothetical protein
MAGVTIRYDGEPDGALDAASQVEDSLGDLEGALDDLARTGADAGDDLTNSLEGAGEAAEESMDALGSGAEMSGREVRSVGRIAKEALEGDLAGAVQAATPLLMSLGPVGVIAGAAAAVGIGAITAGLSGAGAAAEEMVQKITDAYKRAAEEGRAFLSESEIQAIALETIFDTEKREEARAEAERIGIDMQTYIRAQAGDQEALNLVLERTNALIRERQEELQFRPGNLEGTATAADLDQTLFAYNAILGENQAIYDATLDNIAAAQIYQQVVAEGAEQAAIVADRIDSIPTERTASVTVTADTSALDRALARSRTVRVNLEGYARSGQRVI